MKPETWLNKARRKKSVHPFRPNLLELHGEPGITVASDGSRLHLYHGELGVDPIPQFPDFRKVWPQSYELQVAISSKHLLLVIKNALAYVDPKGFAVSLRLNFTPDFLSTYLAVTDLGTHRATIRHDDLWAIGKKGSMLPVSYICTGGSADIRIQPKFLKDALWGMSEIVEIWISQGANAILIKSEAGKGGLDEPCEALIMMMRG